MDILFYLEWIIGLIQLDHVDFDRALIQRVGHAELSKRISATKGDHRKKSITRKIKIWLNSEKSPGFLRILHANLVIQKYLFKVTICYLRNLHKRRVSSGDIPQQIAVCLGLTRQHLPPAINLLELTDFFKSSRFSSQNTPDSILVKAPKSTKFESHNDEIFLASDVPLVLISTFISRQDGLRVIRNLFNESIKFLKLIRARPVIAQFSLEFCECIIYTFESSKYEIGFIAGTHGDSFSQHLSFFLNKSSRNYETRIYHYSENSFKYLANEQAVDSGYLSFVNEVSDVSYVWTQEYSEFMNRESHSNKFVAVGSIIFRENGYKGIIKIPKNEGICVFFDETPTEMDFESQVYSETRSLKILELIVDSKRLLDANQDQNWTFLIKNKRRILPYQSKKYLDRLQELYATQILVEVPWNCDVYKLVSESNCTIAALGSSPAIIARELNKKTAYIFPDPELLGPLKVDYGFPILSQSISIATFLKESKT